MTIFHGCMVWIEKSATRVTDSELRIFLPTPYTHGRCFFLHTSSFTTFDFQSRPCYKVKCFSFKEFLRKCKEKKPTLATAAVRFFT